MEQNYNVVFLLPACRQAGVLHIMCYVIYFNRYTILPLLKSYSVISKVTLSPGNILILLSLIFPDKNPVTSLPSSNTTLKKAFGKASITLPSLLMSFFELVTCIPCPTGCGGGGFCSLFVTSFGSIYMIFNTIKLRYKGQPL